MNRVVTILMKRDHVTEQEAKETVNETREMIHEAIESGDFDSVEDIMYEELGLEMDYIDELIF